MPVAELTSLNNEPCESPESLENAATSESAADLAYQPPLGTTVLRASAWSMAGYGISQFLRLANNMLLSYMLLPEAFGIMAIIYLVIVGLSMFSDVGSGPCIVQNVRGDHYRFLNTAWLIGAFRGVVITCVATALAVPIAAFYELPTLVYLIPLASLTALLNGLASTSIYTLQRHLDLKSLAILDIQSQLIGSVVMCVLAFIRPDVMSLVIGTIATSLSRTVLSHWMIPGYRNRLQFNRTDAKDLFHFGKWVFVSTLLTFATMQVDRIMMGKLFDIGTFGIYGFGLAIAMLPRLMIEKLAGTILYPVLSRAARASTESFRTQLVEARGVLACLGSAMVLAVFAFAPDFFKFFYHPDFHDAGEICQWLCIVSWVGMLTLTLGQALVSLGKTRETARSNGVNLFATIAAALLGFRFGHLEGFIAGLLIGAIAGYFVLVVSLLQTGVSVARQDLISSAVLFTAMAIIFFLQNHPSVDGLVSKVISVIVVAIFGMFAVKQVLLFRRTDKKHKAWGNS